MIPTKQPNTASPKEQLARCYWFSGDETLLVQETRDRIILDAMTHGFTEKNVVHVDAEFNIDTFANLLLNQSLFSEKKIIDLRNPSAKFNPQLQALLQESSKDILLIISTEKLTQAQQNSDLMQWVKKNGRHVVIRPMTRATLPQWIMTRAQKMSLSLTEEIAARLADFTEGNLLATAQALEKLQLMYSNTTITMQELQSVLSDHAQFSIFDLSDALSQGNVKRALRIVKKCRDSGEEPALVLWSICRELRASARTDVLRHAALVDESIKGANTDDPWQGLSQLCWMSCRGGSL